MNFINRIEIQGIVGSVKSLTANGATCYRFSVATENASTSGSGSGFIEATWHNVIAWDNVAGMPDLLRLMERKYMPVNVIGRIHQMKYITPEGYERTINDIVADEIHFLED